jgi:tryptophan 7-halogenase
MTSDNTLNDVLVLGAGSAGLLAALTINRALPQTNVRVVRSPEIGVIGVGESTTPNVPSHLFDFLGISRKRFYGLAEPTWKMGVHFLWGPRDCFEYSFERQLDVRAPELPRPNGFYCDHDFRNMNLQSALMSQQKAFASQPGGGGPEIPSWHAFHLDNPKFVATLEVFARERGIEFIDAVVEGAVRGPEGISAVILADGRRMTADFFIDASGFRSQLLGAALEEPFISFSDSLFNDRAIVGSWQRTDEPILPYTTAETMDAGWCWRIEHETEINRGYVYSSSAISDDTAREEFQRKNPKTAIRDRIVKFRSGRYQRAWVGNVLGIGNACGFVEPLESSALMVSCWQCQIFAELIKFVGTTRSAQSLFNAVWAETWDELRNFLTLHFWANTRLDTPYWRHCRADADISRLRPLLDFYQENGPTGYARYFLGNNGALFGVEGFLVLLVGNRVPYRNRHNPTDLEWQIVDQRRTQFQLQAAAGMGVKQALAYVKHPDWRWYAE